MLKKLRLKFVLINMSIVTIMLCVILGLVFYFTSCESGGREHQYDAEYCGQPTPSRSSQ